MRRFPYRLVRPHLSVPAGRRFGAVACETVQVPKAWYNIQAQQKREKKHIPVDVSGSEPYNHGDRVRVIPLPNGRTSWLINGGY